ncbi:hypothetical protein MENTO_v1c03200 [Mesoplasma entomophilum]|uniref:Uncharacterized protein n=1 Tax=Mesoplasma entomophilum TaxID=2149 RepID=A0A3S5XZ60_9MOLU|nr:hypothetical protein [Mesoplasma entomophilum]ATQ35465.1 hypothetical protein CS528_01650 [Mesoplasma entomophilum]ATZ19426.1 hypothetical protein MENTO_v1c03200 [Mesoplasma entomophilum]
MNFDFLKKLPEHKEKELLIENITAIEKNLVDDKVKHRIRNTMEIFFKTFILNKKFNKLKEHILIDFVKSIEKKIDHSDFQELELTVIYLWRLGNQNTHSNKVDIYNFDRSLTDNIAAFRRLHYLISFLMHKHLGIIFNLKSFDDSIYLRDYMTVDSKVFNNDIIFENENLVKTFSVSNIGIELFKILENKSSILIDSTFTKTIRKIQLVLKSILNSGNNKAPYSLGTIGIAINEHTDTYLVNGKMRLLLYFFSLKSLRSEIKEREMQELKYSKNISTIFEPSFENIEYFKSENNLDAVKRQVDDINLILSSQHTSWRSLCEELKTQEIFEIYECIKNFIFELTDEEFSNFVLGLFQYSQIFMINFNKDKINKNIISNFLQENDDVIFPIQILRGAFKNDSKTESDLLKSSYIKKEKNTKQLVADDYIIRNRGNWIDLFKMQNKYLIDPVIECLVNDKDETYAWLFRYKYNNKVYLFFMLTRNDNKECYFDFEVFNEIVNEYKERYNENLDFIPYLGFFSKIALNSFETDIEYINLRFIEPKDFWQAYYKEPECIDIKKALIKTNFIKEGKTTHIGEITPILKVNEKSNLLITENDLVKATSSVYRVKFKY